MPDALFLSRRFCRLDWSAVCISHYLGIPMKPFRLTLRCSLWLAILATVGCGRKSTGQIVGELSAAQSPSISTPVQSPASSASPSQAQPPQAGQRPTLDLSRLENSAQPAVFWVTVFDSSGKLLRTETAFFVSGEGRFVTTAHARQGP